MLNLISHLRAHIIAVPLSAAEVGLICGMLCDLTGVTTARVSKTTAPTIGDGARGRRDARAVAMARVGGGVRLRAALPEEVASRHHPLDVHSAYLFSILYGRSAAR